MRVKYQKMLPSNNDKGGYQATMTKEVTKQQRQRRNRKKSPKMGLGLVCQNVFLAQTGVPYCELFIFGLCLCLTLF
jgi:hypothetical protein